MVSTECAMNRKTRNSRGAAALATCEASCAALRPLPAPRSCYDHATKGCDCLQRRKSPSTSRCLTFQQLGLAQAKVRRPFHRLSRTSCAFPCRLLQRLVRPTARHSSSSVQGGLGCGRGRTPVAAKGDVRGDEVTNEERAQLNQQAVAEAFRCVIAWAGATLHASTAFTHFWHSTI